MTQNKEVVYLRKLMALTSSELKTVRDLVRHIIKSGGQDFDLLSALTPEDKARIWGELRVEQQAGLTAVAKHSTTTQIPVTAEAVGGLKVGQDVLNLRRGLRGRIVGFEEGGWVRVEGEFWFDALRVEDFAA